MLVTFFAVIALPLLVTTDASEKGGYVVPNMLWAAISVNDPVFDGDEVACRLSLSFAVVNDGPKTVDPKIDQSELVVNGNPLKDWDFIIGSGIRDDRFEALPPGDYLLFACTLGEYFKKPGIYKVSWKGKDFKSPEIAFRVLGHKR